MNMPAITLPPMRSRFCTWNREGLVTLELLHGSHYEADLAKRSAAFWIRQLEAHNQVGPERLLDFAVVASNVQLAFRPE